MLAHAGYTHRCSHMCSMHSITPFTTQHPQVRPQSATRWRQYLRYRCAMQPVEPEAVVCCRLGRPTHSLLSLYSCRTSRDVPRHTHLLTGREGCTALDLFVKFRKTFLICGRLFRSRDYKACLAYLAKAHADCQHRELAVAQYHSYVETHAPEPRILYVRTGYAYHSVLRVCGASNSNRGITGTGASWSFILGTSWPWG